MLQNHPISAAAYLRSHAGRICVAIQGRTSAELLTHAEAAIADSNFLEFRFDSIANPQSIQEAVLQSSSLLAAHKEVAAIATCRRKPHGGNFPGDLEAELDILTQAASSGFPLLDLTLESAEECSPTQLDRIYDCGAQLILSYHDFRSASDPEAAFTRIQRFEPDLVKIVTTAHSLTDSLNLLKWIDRRSSEAQIVAIAMGECGIPSRILSLRAGSAFTFAAAPDGAQTAPGQMTARTLKSLYRVEQLDHATRIYAVAGNPVAHSLSPLMQNTAFARERVNAVYLPLKTESLDDLLHLVRDLPLSGLSITMPLKQTIMAHLANVDPMTAKIGACNTIRLGADHKLYGFNTDVAGIVRPLEKRMPLKGARVLILGSGGAARAAVFGLQEKGAQISLWSRNEPHARELASAAHATTITRKQIAATEFDILINATPCGMTGNAHPFPLDDSEWNARLVFDLVYNPLETPLLKAAAARNIPCIQGVEMFIHQGARQFEIWTGKPAPEAEMHRVVLAALRKYQSS